MGNVTFVISQRKVCFSVPFGFIIIYELSAQHIYGC